MRHNKHCFEIVCVHVQHLVCLHCYNFVYVCVAVTKVTRSNVDGCRIVAVKKPSYSNLPELSYSELCPCIH